MQICPKEVCEDTDFRGGFYRRALPCADGLDPFLWSGKINPDIYADLS